jgi:hypothetical protein
VVVSENYRDALVACAAAAYESRSLPAIGDYVGLLGAARRHGLVPLANRLVQAGSHSAEVKRAFRAQAFLYAVRSAQMESQLGRVLAALNTASVPVIVLKGAALGRTLYPSSTLRPYGDLDVLVHEEDWVAVHEALVSLGYGAIQALQAPPPKVWGRKAYYHTQYQHPDPDLGIKVEVHYDAWWYSLRPRLGEQYWRRAVDLVVGGAQAKMLSAEDQIIQLSAHLHHHGYNRLIWFTDLALLLHDRRIDWDYVVRASREEGIGVFVYYSLHYVERLLGVGPPKGVLDNLRPGLIPAWLHDRLWPPAVVLTVGVEDRVLCDFHEVPSGQELLLNLLLTGRRLEKLVYLARLLTPSSDWLARYYGVTDRATLRSRRLIHAPKMLLKAIRELVTVARDGVTRHPL